MNLPVFDYDDRYFSDCKYNRKELYELQQKTIELMHTSTDLAKDLSEQTDYELIEIKTVLSNFADRGLLQSKPRGSKSELGPVRYYF